MLMDNLSLLLEGKYVLQRQCAPLNLQRQQNELSLHCMCLFIVLMYVNFSGHAKTYNQAYLKESSCLETQNVSW